MIFCKEQSQNTWQWAIGWSTTFCTQTRLHYVLSTSPWHSLHNLDLLSEINFDYIDIVTIADNLVLASVWHWVFLASWQPILVICTLQGMINCKKFYDFFSNYRCPIAALLMVKPFLYPLLQDEIHMHLYIHTNCILAMNRNSSHVTVYAEKPE